MVEVSSDGSKKLEQVTTGSGLKTTSSKNSRDLW